MPSVVDSFKNLRREKDKAHRREIILDAAEKLFRKKGYYLTTTDDIAQESGYSVGTLYNLFKDKERVYAEAIGRIGTAIVARTRQAIDHEHNSEKAIEQVIKLRLYNFSRDRLFFQTFSFDGHAGILPQPSSLPRYVNALYREYLHLVEGLFADIVKREGGADVNPVNLVLSLDATIHVFMAYWEEPGQSGAFDEIAVHIRRVLLSPLAIEELGGPVLPDTPTEEERAIYISKFDLERLKELIWVARSFGEDRSLPHLQELEIRLAKARVVEPRDVPADLITMNSAIRLWNLEDGTETVCTLAFPRDVGSKSELTSVLTPLGTVMLGSRVGDVLEVPSAQHVVRYKVEAIQYQPEAAGDFHL